MNDTQIFTHWIGNRVEEGKALTFETGPRRTQTTHTTHSRLKKQINVRQEKEGKRDKNGTKIKRRVSILSSPRSCAEQVRGEGHGCERGEWRCLKIRDRFGRQQPPPWLATPPGVPPGPPLATASGWSLWGSTSTPPRTSSATAPSPSSTGEGSKW